MGAADGLIGGRYRPLQKLGAGGFGTVWSARDEQTGDRVAVKVLHAQSQDARRRFVIETKVLAQLNHPHSVRYVDSGVSGDDAFLVTELVEGQPLQRWLQSGPSQVKVRRVFAQVAGAVAFAHRRGVTHRDLKPSNILVTERQGAPHAVVLDFGLAKLLRPEGPALTKTGEILGTPGFMSPEQLRGIDVGDMTDVYALGVILFEAFEGEPLFEGDSPLAISMAHLKSEPPPLTKAPPAVAALVPTMLEKEPVRRPPMHQVEATLRGDHPTMATSAETPHSNGPNLGLIVGAAVAIVVAVAGGVWAVLSPEPQEPVAKAQRQNPLAVVQPTVEQPPAESVPEVVDSPEPSTSYTQAPDHDCPIEPDGERHVIGDLAVYLPSSRSGKTPFVLVAHDQLQNRDRVLEARSLRCMAELYQTALLLPHDELRAPWEGKNDVGRIRKLVSQARRKFGLGEAYGLGMGSGANLIEGLVCDDFEFQAIAEMPSYRSAELPFCPEKAVPRLNMYAALDTVGLVAQAVDGPKVSATEERKLIRDARSCSKEERGLDVRSVPGVSCRFDICSSETLFCDSERGRYWDSMVIRLDGGGFESPTPSPHNLVWWFFSRHGLTEPSTENPMRVRPESGSYDIWVYVPSTAPAADRPAILVMRDAGQTPQMLANYEPLQKMAEGTGAVLVIPDTGPLGVWTLESEWRGAWKQFKDAAPRLRIDIDNAGFLGFGQGGRAVEYIACERKHITPVASVGWIRSATEQRCDKAFPRFRMWHTPQLADIGRDILPADERVGHLREVHQCTGKGTPSTEAGHACTTYTCSTPLKVCETKRGRYWDGLSIPPFNLNDAPNLAEEVGEFLKASAPKQR